MNQIILDNTQYVFVPASEGIGTITFSNLGFSLEQSNIFEILNVEEGENQLVYNPSKVGLGGTLVGLILTLEGNTAGITADNLQITLKLTALQSLFASNRQPNIQRYLDTIGDGTGIKNAIGNYSAGGIEEFFIQHQIGTNPICLSRLLVNILDNGTLQADGYGALAALPVGVKIEKQDKNGIVLIDFVDGINIKTNGDYGKEAYDTETTDYGTGASDNYVRVRWTFTKDAGFLTLNNEEKLVVTLNDSFIGLLGHFFKVKGFQQL